MKRVRTGIIPALKDGLMIVGTDKTYSLPGEETTPEFIGYTPLDITEGVGYDWYYTIDLERLSQVDWHTASIQGKELFWVRTPHGNLFMYGNEIDDDRIDRSNVQIYHIEKEGN